jgi:multiple sugar transport system permease protein
MKAIFKQKIGRIFILSGLVAITIAFIFPFFWILVLSLKTRVDALTMPPKWFFVPTLENYVMAFLERGYTRTFLNSLIVATSSTALSLICGVPAAYTLSRFNFRGEKQLFFTILTTRMAPPIVLVLPLFVVFSNLGMIDNYLSIILVHTVMNLAFVIWIMQGFFNEVPIQIDEAAIMDGDTRFEAFMRQVLPLVIPGLIVTGIFCFVASWNEFLFALILTGFETRTFTVAVPALITPHGTYWGQVAAIAVIATLPVVIIGILMRRYLVRELTFGLIRE